MSKQLLSFRSDQAGMGPLLEDLIATHRAKEEALRFPEIRELASEVVKRCRDLDSPLLWPIDQASERLAGAITMVAGGNVRVRGWTSDICGERVLLLAVSETTPMSMVEGAARARSLGAIEVHGCALEVPEFESSDLDGVFDSRVALGAVLLATPLAMS